MRWTYVFILLVLWTAGFVTSTAVTTTGGVLRLLLVAGLVVGVARAIRGHREI